MEKRQKIPLSCHNNPNLFEDWAMLERMREKGKRKKKKMGMEEDPWSAVMNVATSEPGLRMVFLSNGLIAQLILWPVLCRPPLMWKQLYFLPD